MDYESVYATMTPEERAECDARTAEFARKDAEREARYRQEDAKLAKEWDDYLAGHKWFNFPA